MHDPQSYDTIIIGGGLSGLAAAVKLSLSGAKVALFEQSPNLGGRCYSFIDESTGDCIDNGQHLLVGAYHNLFQYLEFIGARDLVREESSLTLHLHHPEKGFGTFSMGSLPRPFHLVEGILKFNFLSGNDRRRLANVWWDLLGWNSSIEERLRYQTVDQWLMNLNQSEEARRSLWDPLSVSIMNESPLRASALLFARSLRATIFGKKSDAALVVPRTGQTELYVHGALRVFKQRNCTVKTSAEVSSISIAGEAVNGVVLRDGTFVPSRYVISTVPFYNINAIIPQPFFQFKSFRNIDKFTTSPIISVYLWFDKEFMETEHMGLIGQEVQWVFNRRRLFGESDKSTSCLCAVISGAHQLVNASKDEIITAVLRDIRIVYPESPKATVVHSLVLKEKRATFSPITDVEHYRPSCITPIENFFLAGDWTNTGYPATIEGAVTSGFTAAEKVLETAV